jgi:UDP-N-acetylglucosamine 3-dehydrogenase
VTRIGILSFDHLHAESYQENLKKIPDVQLVGFSHENSEEGAEIARKFGIKWFPEHNELLAAGLDGAVICSVTNNHRKLVELAANAGCQILCEKPIATSVADSEAMCSACEECGVRFMTAFPMRFASSAISLRAMIRKGDIGMILGVNGINHSEIPTGHRRWFGERTLAGGGAVMDHTVHLVDLFRWIFEAEITEVYAEVNNLLYSTQVEVETAGLMLLTFSNGLHASIDCSWSRPTFYPRWGHLRMEVIGEQGAVAMDGFAEHVTLYSRGAPRNPSWIGFGQDPNQAMIEEFVASIRETRTPQVTWQDGNEALKVTLAAYESAHLQRPVKLPAGPGGC